MTTEKEGSSLAHDDSDDMAQRRRKAAAADNGMLIERTENEMELTPLSPDRYHDEDEESSALVSGEKSGFEMKPIEPTYFPPWLDDFLFPKSLPRECQLLRMENIAVPACYLLVGLLLGLSSPLINAYPLDLGATEAQQTSISAIRSLPASFKLIFGFLSDSIPLLGYRRKSYMLLGWSLCSASYFLLLFGSNLHMEELGATGCSAKSQLGEKQAIPPVDAPSMPFLSFCALAAGTGLWFADVMGDSIVAEKAKLEPPDKRGSVQSTCYSYRFFGSMIFPYPIQSHIFMDFR